MKRAIRVSTTVGTLLSIVLVFDVFAWAAPATAALIEERPVHRLGGDDRIATSIAVSRAGWGPSPGRRASSAVLARADSFPDALAGTPRAVVSSGPLLLTPPGALDTRVGDEMRRILAPGATVFVLGGQSALSDDVASSVQALGLRTSRIGGTNRFDTARRVAESVPSVSAALLVDGTTFADALSSGAAARQASGVILLTNGTALPAETAAYLAARPALKRYAIGGAAAAADPTAEPVVGADRFETSRLVAEKFFPSPARVGIANGLDFPDGLSGGALLGHRLSPFTPLISGPLLLTRPESTPAVLTEYLRSNQGTISKAFILGGDAVTSSGVLSATTAALTCDCPSMISFENDDGVGAAQVSSIRGDLSTARALQGESGPVTVYAFSTRENYVAAYKLRHGESAGEAAGTRIDNGAGLEAGFGSIWLYMPRFLASPSPFEILYHEHFHAVQNNLIGYAVQSANSDLPEAGPRWLLEGTADYFNYRTSESVGTVSYSSRVSQTKAASRNIGFPLRNYGSIDSAEASGGQANLYRLGFLAADYLASRYGVDTIRRHLWLNLATGEQWQTAFQKTFGVSVESFYSDFEAYRASF